jgi:hypothetical protein
VVSPRVQDEERISRDVTARLTEARRRLAQVDPARLVGDQREIFASVQDFLTKAEEAMAAKDLPRAQILADKARKLADDLVAAVNRR